MLTTFLIWIDIYVKTITLGIKYQINNFSNAKAVTLPLILFERKH